MFKVGDKIVCIDDSKICGADNIKLTKLKVYDALEPSGCIESDLTQVYIIEDSGEKYGFYNKRFILLAEFRDKRINEILNDE